MPTQHADRMHIGRPHVNPWLVAVVLLTAALVAFGAWVVVDRVTTSPTAPAPSSTPGLASPETDAILEDRLAALNAGDAEAVSAFYTSDAVLEERDVTPPVVTTGSEQIGRRIAGLVNTFGMQLERASPVIEFGLSTAEAVRSPSDPTLGWILVYRFAPNGKIAHQWVLPTGEE